MIPAFLGAFVAVLVCLALAYTLLVHVVVPRFGRFMMDTFTKAIGREPTRTDGEDMMVSAVADAGGASGIFGPGSPGAAVARAHEIATAEVERIHGLVSSGEIQTIALAVKLDEHQQELRVLCGCALCKALVAATPTARPS